MQLPGEQQRVPYGKEAHHGLPWLCVGPVPEVAQLHAVFGKEEVLWGERHLPHQSAEHCGNRGVDGKLHHSRRADVEAAAQSPGVEAPPRLAFRCAFHGRNEGHSPAWLTKKKKSRPGARPAATPVDKGV